MSMTVSLTGAFNGANGTIAKRHEQDFSEDIAALFHKWNRYLTGGSITGDACTYAFTAGALKPTKLPA